jgi:hypothetical protein
MKLLHGFCCLVLGIAFCLASGQASQGGKDKAKDTAKAADDSMIVGKIKIVNLARNNFIITLESGKERTFTVYKNTKFLGPQGGPSKSGLKDDRMAKGYEVKVMPTKDGKVAKEVHLAYRNKKTSGKK